MTINFKFFFFLVNFSVQLNVIQLKFARGFFLEYNYFIVELDLKIKVQCCTIHPNGQINVECCTLAIKVYF